MAANAFALPIILIPARLAATRLPNKPLAPIAGLPMIIQVWRRGQEAGLGRVVVAAGDPEIAAAVTAHGGEAVLTDPDLPSGTDRIHAALQQIDAAGRHDAVINLQGDLPTLDPHLLATALTVLSQPGVDIATLAAPISRPAEITAPHVVKAAIELPAGQQHGRALYFSRTAIPSGDGPHYHHIGVYAYRRAALERFVASPPAALETREKLEQLRALALGMRIDCAVVATVPLGVDTAEELERARQILEKT